jgi:hypothetical protein
MQALNIKEITFVQEKYQQYNNIKCFIESGTFEGSTIFPLSNFFNQLHTIELYDKYYHNAVSYAKKNKINNISFHHGDSSEILPKLALEIKEPVVFYLDGHFCGKKSRAITPKDNFPLFNEINAINDFRDYNDIVIIDDYRLFGKNDLSNEIDWREVTEINILKCFNKNNVFSYFSKNDRFYILLKHKV